MVPRCRRLSPRTAAVLRSVGSDAREPGEAGAVEREPALIVGTAHPPMSEREASTRHGNGATRAGVLLTLLVGALLLVVMSMLNGAHGASVKLDLPAGTYRWSVPAMDLAHWAQEKKVPQTLVVKQHARPERGR